MQTFQPKKGINSKKNNTKEKNNLNQNIEIKKTESINNNKNKKGIKPKLSQEIMNINISLLGQIPISQNLKPDEKNNNNDNKNKEEKLNLKNIKEKKINNNKDNNNKSNNNLNKIYNEPYKPLAHYIIDKNLRFEENKSKNKNNNKKISLGEKNNLNEFNSDEEDELIKSKRRKINLALNQDKKNNKLLQEKAKLKKELNSLINDTESDKPEKEPKSEKKELQKKPLKKSVSGNFVRLNLKKKYQEKKRFRPVKLRKIALNHSRELYKYQKKTIKNSTSNYMGKGNQGLEDMDTLMKEQNEAEKNNNDNLLNTLVDKLPVFSQSFIEETQKTPVKIDEDKNKEIKEDNKNIINNNINNKTPITNR